MADMKQFQPLVKNVGGVLVGVAQVRVGKPSVRDAGTAEVKSVQYVGTSEKKTDATSGTSVDYIKPLDTSTGGTLPAGCTLASGGTYTGEYDGCFIIQATSATLCDIYAPNGYKDAGVTISSFASTPLDMNLGSGEPSGATIEGVPATTITAGMTWIVPVWSGAAQTKVQTGIISPYSMFSGSAESVGGLKSASFVPKMDSIKTLESGFPSVTVDRIVEKTSVDIKMEAQEFTNANIDNLRSMMSKVINDATISAIPVEVLVRKRDNSIVSFWIPNAGLTQFPEINPQNDFSSLTWELGASQLTEVTGESAIYNTWVNHTPIFSELSYLH